MDSRVPRRVVRADGDGSAVFALVGSGAAAEDVREFLIWLAAHGRGSYTQRSYALGLAHFLDWLDGRGHGLGEVDRGAVAEYVAWFGRGEDGFGAVRQPRTVNHRVSVLGSFFAFLVGRDGDRGRGVWAARPNPVAVRGDPADGGHGMGGRDAPRRGRRGELRQRVPRTLPGGVAPEVARALIDAAVSWRDTALLTLLWRTGQRIGDWSDTHGQHGVLGMRLGDLDRRSGTVVVRLKGARDEHRVPVSDDFWAPFERYLSVERGLGEPRDPAWVALRKGRGRPLRYATFESSLRFVADRVGVRVSAHMFRHALAQALVDTAGLKVAQEVLGHAHVATTAGTYARVDEQAMVRALAGTRDLFDLAAAAGRARTGDVGHGEAGGFVFPYATDTVAELEDTITTGRGRGVTW